MISQIPFGNNSYDIALVIMNGAEVGHGSLHLLPLNLSRKRSKAAII